MGMHFFLSFWDEFFYGNDPDVNHPTGNVLKRDPRFIPFLLPYLSHRQVEAPSKPFLFMGWLDLFFREGTK